MAIHALRYIVKNIDSILIIPKTKSFVLDSSGCSCASGFHSSNNLETKIKNGPRPGSLRVEGFVLMVLLRQDFWWR